VIRPVQVGFPLPAQLARLGRPLAERGRQAHRHRRRWRGMHRRAGDRARRTGHQPGDRLLTSRSM